MCRRNKQPKVSKWKLPKEDAKVHARAKKVKRALRVTRLRPLKNFLYWFFGVLSSVAIVALGIFVGVKVVPISTYMGNMKNEEYTDYVSENVASKSFLDAVMGLMNNQFTFEDFPIIDKTLGEALGDDDLPVLKEYQVTDAPSYDSQGNFIAQRESDKATHYYYQSDTPPYAAGSEMYFKAAFDENGQLVGELKEKIFTDGKDVTFYIKPLLKMPILEAVGCLDKYLDYVQITDLLTLFGDVTGGEIVEGVTIYDLLKGVAVGDLTKPAEQGGFSADMILKNLTLDIVGGASALGQLGEFDFFTDFQVVPSEEMPIVESGYITQDADKFTSNPKLYYVKVVDNGGVDDVYARAFTDEGQFITEYYIDKNGELCEKNDGEPALSFDDFNDAKTSNKILYANLSKIPLLEAVNLIGDSIGRETVENLLVKLGVTLEDKIYDILCAMAGKDDPANLTVGDLILKEGQELQFGNIKLDILLGEPDTSGGNKQIYDILCAMAGKDDPTTLTIGDLIPEEGQELQFDNIKLDILLGEPDTTGGNKQIYDILCSIAGKDDPANLTIGDLIPEKGQELQFGNIKLDILLGEPDTTGGNKQIYDILCSIAGKDDPANLTIGDLIPEKGQELQFGNIKLDILLGEPDTTGGNKQIYDILCALAGKDDPANLTIGDLIPEEGQVLQFGNIKLEILLGAPDKEGGNKQIYDILLSVTDKTDASTLTIGDLIPKEGETLKFDNITLCTILGAYNENTNGKVYDILCNIVGENVTPETITIGHLTSKPLEFNNLLLKDFLELEDTAWDALCQYVQKPGASKDNLTLGDLADIEITEIGVTSALGSYDKNPILYDVLLSASKKMPEKGAMNDAEFLQAKKDAAENLVVNDFNNLDLTLIKLDAVLKDTTSPIYDILTSALNKEASEITIGMIESLKVDDIKLVDVIANDTNTADLYKILKSVTGLEPDQIKISNLTSTAFNIKNILLTDVLAENENLGIYKILVSAIGSANGVTSAGDITIDKLSKFNINNVLLSDVIENTNAQTDKLFNILASATGEAKADVKIGDIISNKFSVDNIKLKDVLTDTSSSIYKILLSALEGVDNIDGITVGKLSDFNINNVYLIDVITDTSAGLYDILESVTGLEANQIKISDLSSFNINNIGLTSVLPESANADLYKILLSAIRDDSGVQKYTNASDIKISDFNDFEVGSIGLTSVLEQTDDNKALYDILLEASKANSYQEITLGKLGTFKFDDLKLSLVLDPDVDQDLYKILAEIYPDVDVKNDLTIGMLSDFDISGVTLGTVLLRSEHGKLYEIFDDALDLGSGETVEGVKLCELDAKLNLSQIHLQTIFTESTGNQILDALIEKNIEIGNIGSEINNLGIETIIDVEDFTTSSSNTFNANAKYYKVTDNNGELVAYTLSSNVEAYSGTYNVDQTKEFYISKKASVWLLVLYTCDSSFDTNGNALAYESSHVNIGNMSEKIASMSSSIERATIRQLVDMGILTDNPSIFGNQFKPLYNKTLISALTGNIA